MIAALLPLALQAAAPVIAGDWSVACDNQRDCTAWSRVPDGAVEADYPLVVLRRDGAAGAVPTLDVPIAAATPAGARLNVAVDERVLAQLVAPGSGAGLSLPFTGKLATALRGGRMLTLAEPRGRVRRRTSLAGLGATLATIDAVQLREGKRGPVVAVPPLPVVMTPPPGALPARALSRKQLQALMGKPPKGCGPILSRSYRLDAGHSLLAIDPPCATPGSDVLAYVLPEKGVAQPASFTVPAAASGAVAYQVAGGWDVVRRRVAVLLPATPGRDCGTRRAFAWDGAMFRLVEERIVAECRRATLEIVTYRAQVNGG